MSQVSSNNYPQGIIAKGHIEKDFKFNTLSGSALGTIQAQLPHLPLSNAEVQIALCFTSNAFCG
ncbi:Uncharacterised protein [Cedecea lapagei]|uniref:Uncharacterized protein n=1 Tax=Cedecea lapagei TaxID=158823 RepID=A0A447V119_9ENTR|nr:hypothetical protein [Cedecea lapagei]VEB96840.1 Uncharacterised protein [Cedecea lapagei]